MGADTDESDAVRPGTGESGTEESDTEASGIEESDQDRAVRSMRESPLFPFTAAPQLKELSAVMSTELTREGEGGRPCKSCGDDGRVLWCNERWKVTGIRPSANPVGLFLETVEHVDFEHFDEDMASEFGRLTMHLEAGIRLRESVGRVHVHRWGDGSAHFHVWFQGRPAGQLELYGWGNVLWAQLLEPLPADQIDADHAAVIAHLHAAVGGTIGHAPPSSRPSSAPRGPTELLAEAADHVGPVSEVVSCGRGRGRPE